MLIYIERMFWMLDWFVFIFRKIDYEAKIRNIINDRISINLVGFHVLSPPSLHLYKYK